MPFHKEVAILESQPASVAVRPTGAQRCLTPHAGVSLGSDLVCVGCTALHIKEQLADVKAFTILNTAAAAAEVVK